MKKEHALKQVVKEVARRKRRRERGRTGESAFGVPFRRFSSFSFSLTLCNPHQSCTSSDYVVIGLSYEPCDAVLQIHLQFSIVSPSFRSEGACNRAQELPRNPVLLEAVVNNPRHRCENLFHLLYPPSKHYI